MFDHVLGAGRLRSGHRHAGGCAICQVHLRRLEVLFLVIYFATKMKREAGFIHKKYVLAEEATSKST